MKSFKVLILLSSVFLWQPILQAGKAQDKELLKAAKDGKVKHIRHALKEAFLKPAANIDYQDKNGQTPLFWAAHNDNLEAVQYLLEREADVNLRSTSGTSPLDLILQNLVVHKQKNPNSVAIILLLAHNGAEVPEERSLQKKLNKLLKKERIEKEKQDAATKIQKNFRGHREREKTRNNHNFTLKNETGSEILVTITLQSPRVYGAEQTGERKGLLLFNIPITLKAGATWTSTFSDPTEAQPFSPCLAATIRFSSTAKSPPKEASSKKSFGETFGSAKGSSQGGITFKKKSKGSFPPAIRKAQGNIFFTREINRQLARDTVVRLRF